MDKVIENYLTPFLEENKDAEVFIWSDHGFADVTQYIDLEKILPKRKDFTYFIAGTTASFWFKNDEAKKQILELIEGIKEIKILNQTIAEKFKIPFSQEYGEFIVYLEKGHYFFPNFYQKYKKEKFKAMHGYPTDDELNGIFLSNKKLPKIVSIDLAIRSIK